MHRQGGSNATIFLNQRYKRQKYHSEVEETNDENESAKVKENKGLEEDNIGSRFKIIHVKGWLCWQGDG